jgi:DNA polymerase V
MSFDISVDLNQSSNNSSMNPPPAAFSRHLVALVDCNNFFVSCERLFNPKWIKRPVAVLSCNDGCIVARSQEIKAWGIPMGAPYFEWADFLKAREAVVCSSNFALYADISHRVMQTLCHFNPNLEIYSIDEAFLLIEGTQDPLQHCRHIRQKVLQWTGIPVSIGIAPTKTLAKVANRAVKKNPAYKGVYFPSQKEIEALLDTLEVGEIWGIGSRLSRFLAKRGIFTAAQLREQPDLWIKNNLTVVGLRTVWELRGFSCLDLEEVRSSKQSIMTSRSFGRPVLAKEELREAICAYVVRGAEKLREEGSLASWLQVFIMSSFHHHEDGFYGNHVHLVLPQPTDFTPTLLTHASQGLETIFRSGFSYKKAGILLGELVPSGCYQQDLFVKQDVKEEVKKKAVMALLDQANSKFGYKVLQFASEGIEKDWQMKREMRTACFTTRWSDLLTINI